MSKSRRCSAQKRQLRMRLFSAVNGSRCCFCRRQLAFDEATLEHVIPLAHGGGWGLANLRISCQSCNHDRGTEDFFAFMAKRRLALLVKKQTPALAVEQGGRGVANG